MWIFECFRVFFFNLKCVAINLGILIEASKSHTTYHSVTKRLLNEMTHDFKGRSTTFFNTIITTATNNNSINNNNNSRAERKKEEKEHRVNNKLTPISLNKHAPSMEKIFAKPTKEMNDNVNKQCSL